jgi:hypothetical protein
MEPLATSNIFHPAGHIEHHDGVLCAKNAIFKTPRPIASKPDGTKPTPFSSVVAQHERLQTIAFLQALGQSS